MRIALVAPGSIPAHTANSIQTMKMAQAFVALGHDLRLYAPGEDPQASWDELADHYGLRHKFPIQWRPRRRFLRGYDYGGATVMDAKAWGADLVYTRHPQAAAFGAQRGLPAILEMHDLPHGRGGPRLLKVFSDGPGARKLVAITRALADALRESYRLPDKLEIQVAPDGVDLERYANLPTPSDARRQLGLPDTFTAGYTGSLYAGRGIELILALAHRLPEMHFLIAGGRDDEVARVRQQAADLNNLTLIGFVPNAELPRYQAASDVLLAPYQQQVSASSGGDIAAFLSPMKLFEYLASGRPILAGQLPVLREVLNDQNAILLPGDDADAWATALHLLAADAGARQRLGAAARHSAQGYSWRARAAAILDGLG
jgi:glycosyltransferase involved in cell wall biosynthesis